MVQRWEIATGASKQLYEVPIDEEDIEGITVTPSGAIIVGITTTAADRSRSGRFARLDPSTGMLEALPVKGDVRSPK
jgi:hypothetical protein